mgnify:CR=1 FL=1
MAHSLELEVRLEAVFVLGNEALSSGTEQVQSLGAGVLDRRINGVGVQAFRIARNQQRGHIAQRQVIAQPSRFVFWSENKRSAVVTDGVQDAIGRRGDDGETRHFFARVLIDPLVPNSGEGEGPLSIAPIDHVRFAQTFLFWAFQVSVGGWSLFWLIVEPVQNIEYIEYGF